MKRNTWKKIVATALTAFMLTPVLAAATEADNSAEAAIALAKTVLPIPEAQTEFRYDNMGGGTYRLEWSTPDGENSTDVTVQDGVIVGYYAYDGSSNRGLSTLSKNDIRKIAEDFIKTVVPDLSDKLVVLESNSRRVAFSRYENGARVEENGASVYVNKMTGKVTSYDLNWDFENEFSGASSLAPDAALAALGNSALRLEYDTFWPVVKDAPAGMLTAPEEKPTAYPVYRTNDLIRVNAATGESFEASFGYTSANSNGVAMKEDMSVAESDSGGSGSYRLTRQEQAQVDAMKELISKEAAAEKIAGLTELWLPESYDLEMNYYSNRYSDGEVKYTAAARLSWTQKDEGGEDVNCDASVSMDGKTGEIASINIYRPDIYDSAENPVSDEVCKAAADSLLAKIKNLDGYRAEENKYSNKRRFDSSYVKYIGEIPYPDDNKSVSVSKKSGKVISFYETTPDANIITPASMVSASEAAAMNFEAELVYSYSDGKPVLSYALKPNKNFFAVKAADGSAIDYNGVSAPDRGEKTDEPTHWAWADFDLLRENDIYIEGNYMLDDFVTFEDFNNLARMAANIGDLPFYRYIDEKAGVDMAKNSDFVSREGAAEIIMKQMGWEKLIGLDIFETKFADEANFAGGVGGAAILQGLGIMNGDGTNFRPADNLTYGEAYAIARKLAEFGVKSEEQ